MDIRNEAPGELVEQFQERAYERMRKQLSNPAETGQEKTSPGFRKLIMQVTLKAKSNGVTLSDLIGAAKGLGRRMMPYTTSGDAGRLFRAMVRLTRYERIALNAMAGTRPAAKNDFGQLAPIHPLQDDWLHRPNGGETKHQSKLRVAKRNCEEALEEMRKRIERTQAGEKA